MTEQDPATSSWDGVLFGAAYYNEYQTTDRLDLDLDLMQKAHFSVIRVGESVWSTWEPRDGEFDLDWMQPILDGAHERGIAVVLGTPTYAVPPWLQVKHPELAAETATGVRRAWGSRQEVDYSSELFRSYAERVIRAIAERYAQHPAVIGFQVDNEPGMELFHNAQTFEQFLSYLQTRYGTPENLNRDWGLTYWSHKITEWSQLWRPDGNSAPQYDLAWRRFQARITTEFIGWQARILAEYARDDQFVTTCIAYLRPGVDDYELTGELDITAGNLYFGMQDGLDARTEVEALEDWTTTGVWGLTKQADRLYSSRQERFLVTETGITSIAGPHQNYPPEPGQIEQVALAFVARGARMIEYWHWHTLHFGAETYWGGILPHSQVPGRIYDEVVELGARLEGLAPVLDGYRPDADIAIVYSTESRWAMEYFPPLGTERDNVADPESYNRIFDAYYRGIVESGAQARILHDKQLAGFSAEELVARHPVLVAPALYIADDELLETLRAYAAAGGLLVVGVRTGYADEEARARREVAPPRLAEAAQLWYDEYSNLRGTVGVLAAVAADATPTSETDAAASVSAPPLVLSPDAAGFGWLDYLHADGARVLASYDHPRHAATPAVTQAVHGLGRISYVGTVPNTAFARDLGRWLAPRPATAAWNAAAPEGVVVTSGTNAAGDRVLFVHNWTPTSLDVVAPVAATTVAATPQTPGRTLAAGETLSMTPWSAVVLIESSPADRS
ncbi:beta-galactosidase [Compostimonas suwonensis]|uniref:beta-galactosidase n=1 Tax=Compostimonas suwonensis TaxID=1048394 RepID=A0A2M9C4Q1_9MICO|nr:beta-galactosidase [Compostimonas suwonensis]PJJ65496.1 beta-galactosidase [Compostimonas suwonensis]